MTVGRAWMEDRRRMAAVRFAAGATAGEVARELLVSRVAAWRWRKAWVSGKGLDATQGAGRPCRLSLEQLRALYAVWETREKWTTAAFAEAIEAAFGVGYSADHAGRLILRLGLREKRVRRPRAAEQMELVEELAGGSACSTTELAHG